MTDHTPCMGDDVHEPQVCALRDALPPKVRVKVLGPSGEVMRTDVIPLDGVWALDYYQPFVRIVLERTADDADPGTWERDSE